MDITGIIFGIYTIVRNFETFLMQYECFLSSPYEVLNTIWLSCWRWFSTPRCVVCGGVRRKPSPLRSNNSGSECFLPISASERTASGKRLLSFLSFWWWWRFNTASRTFGLNESSSCPDTTMLSITMSEWIQTDWKLRASLLQRENPRTHTHLRTCNVFDGVSLHV